MTSNMNTTSEDHRVNLYRAALEGDINCLYTVIQLNPHVLEEIDSIPFVQTPLHVAASVENLLVEHLQFSIEIMRLKPSFAGKLNPEGYTPIHLALQRGHDKMVLRFISINKDLVRAKGKEGYTPLHFATEKGKIDLLAEFLRVCPDSIEDVTIRNETALHIAVKHGNYEALQVLLGWLMRTFKTGARQLEKTILNWKDEEGNTILHAASSRQDDSGVRMVRLLVKTKVDLKAKNFEERSAFDMAEPDGEIRSILVGANANSSVTDVATYAELLKSKMTFIGRISIFISRIKRDITEDQRNAYLIIAALIATATYQSVLSPPGGLFQASVGDNIANTTSLNSTSIAIPMDLLGTSILTGPEFFFFLIYSIISFLASTMIIIILTPAGIVDRMMLMSIFWFLISYVFSLLLISPIPVNPLVGFAIVCLTLLIFLSMRKLFQVWEERKGCGR